MASNLLTPEGLAALAEGVDSGELAVDTGFNMQARVVKHDLASEDSTLGINLTSIDMINERFVRQFRVGLLDVLRTAMKINAKEVEIMKFGEYLKDLRAPLSVNTIRLNPLRGYSVAIIEPSIIFAALDNFFGGFGRGYDGVPPNRMFTPTETNPAYGRLWWLNGGAWSIAAGGVRRDGALVPEAPTDLVAGLGALNRQVFIVPSRGLVIVRTGAAAPDTEFTQQVWARLSSALPE